MNDEQRIQIGAMVLQFPPLLHLEHGVAIPLDKVPAEPVAKYDLPYEEAEEIARASSIPGVASAAEFREYGTKGDHFRWSFVGRASLVRVKYPAPFLVACYKVDVHGQTRTRHKWHRCFHAAVVDEVSAAEMCAIDQTAHIFDDTFRAIVQASAFRLWGEPEDATADDLRVDYQGRFVTFESGDAIVARFVRLMLSIFPDQQMLFADAAAALKSGATNQYDWARGLCSKANNKYLPFLQLGHELKATKKTGAFHWSPLIT